jgi:hypothetical protein
MQSIMRFMPQSCQGWIPPPIKGSSASFNLKRNEFFFRTCLVRWVWLAWLFHNLLLE